MSRPRVKYWLDADKAGTDSYVVIDDLTLKIADCRHNISLEFGFGQYVGRNKTEALLKVQVLRNALDVLERNIKAGRSS